MVGNALAVLNQIGAEEMSCGAGIEVVGLYARIAKRGWVAHVFRRGGHDYDTRIVSPPPKGMGHPSHHSRTIYETRYWNQRETVTAAARAKFLRKGGSRREHELEP